MTEKEISEIVPAAQLAGSNPVAETFWGDVVEQLDAAEEAGKPEVEQRVIV